MPAERSAKPICDRRCARWKVTCCVCGRRPTQPRKGFREDGWQRLVSHHPSWGVYFLPLLALLGARWERAEPAAVFAAEDVRVLRSTFDAADAALALVLRELVIRGHLPSAFCRLMPSREGLAMKCPGKVSVEDSQSSCPEASSLTSQIQGTGPKWGNEAPSGVAKWDNWDKMWDTLRRQQ